MKLNAGIVFTAIVATATMAVVATAQRQEEQVAAVKGYQQWKLVNSEPYRMPMRVAVLCAATPGGAGGGGIDAGPHNNKFVRVYVNDLAAPAMLEQKTPKFPVGSVIIKEKLASKEARSPELSTVMVKHPAGYNPAQGDWEYMVLNGSATKVESSGKLESCISCHAGQSGEGYVFRSYLSSKQRSALK
jgi:hypothetical protein